MEVFDAGPARTHRFRFDELEYNVLQDLPEAKKLKLIQKDHRYFELLDDPSPLLKVVYTEELIAYLKLHSKLLISGMVDLEERVQLYLSKMPPKKEIMKDLRVSKNNAIHFIKAIQ